MTLETYKEASDLIERKERIENILTVLNEPDSKTVISCSRMNIILGSYRYDKPILDMVKRSYQGLLADVNKEFEAL